MMIKAESYKIFSEIYCPIVPAPLELFSSDGCRSEQGNVSHNVRNHYIYKKKKIFKQGIILYNACQIKMYRKKS